MRRIYINALLALAFTSQVWAVRFKKLEEEVPLPQTSPCPSPSEVRLTTMEGPSVFVTPLKEFSWERLLAVPPGDRKGETVPLTRIDDGVSFPWCSYIGINDGGEQVVIQTPKLDAMEGRGSEMWEEQKNNQEKLGYLIAAGWDDNGQLWIVLKYQGAPLQLTKRYRENFAHGSIESSYKTCKKTVLEIQVEISKAMFRQLEGPRDIYVHYDFSQLSQGSLIGDMLFRPGNAPIIIHCVAPFCTILERDKANTKSIDGQLTPAAQEERKAFKVAENFSSHNLYLRYAKRLWPAGKRGHGMGTLSAHELCPKPVWYKRLFSKGKKLY